LNCHCDQSRWFWFGRRPAIPSRAGASTPPDEWRAFVAALSLDPRIPDIIRLKFERAQKLFLLGWIDADLIKGAELVALTTLELALKDRFGHVVPRLSSKKVDPSSPEALMAQPIRYSFRALLRRLVDKEGFTDAQIPMIARCGGSAIGQLTGATRPTRDDRRNAMAHGDLISRLRPKQAAFASRSP
jgi:hypothetical protein